jgi:hypothetical protein
MEGSFEQRKEPAIYLPGISWLAVQALDSQEKLCSMKLVILSLVSRLCCQIRINFRGIGMCNEM